MREAGSHIVLGLRRSTLNKVIPPQYLHCGNLLVPQPLELSFYNLNRYLLIEQIYINHKPAKGKINDGTPRHFFIIET